MKKLTSKITPLLVISILVIVFCLVEIIILLLSKEKGELATGLLSILILIFSAIFIFDRFIVNKISHKKIIFFESLLLLSVVVICMFFDKSTKIKIETQRKYFIVLYNEKGIKKEQIPKTGIFNRSITINNQTILNLHSSLQNDKEITILNPKDWNNGNAYIYFDTIINSKKESYQLYYHDMEKELAESILKKTCH